MKILAYILAVSIALIACSKKDKVYPDPYAGGRAPLGVTLSTDAPAPSEAAVGTVITFKGSGLLPHKDSIHFNFNGEAGEIVAVDSTGIQVKVPATASTGVTSVSIGDQVFIGPVFKVKGNLDIDNTWKGVVGSSSWVNDLYRFSDGRILLIGDFLDYEHKGVVKPIGRIVLISKDGEIDRSLQSGRGSDGSLSTIGALPSGKLVVGGSFASYDIHLAEMHNITVLNANGSIDSTVVNTFEGKDTVPAFNGGTDGNISRVFVHENKITAVGSFSYYEQYVYGISDYLHERDSLVVDSIPVRNLIRFFPDGSLDSSFNYNTALHRSNDGANGPIADACMQDDGKLIIVGRFTRYNGMDAPYIARINTDGSLDQGFGGAGADNTIASIRYNATTQRFVLAGVFRKFDGVDHHGLVMLKTDGTVDPQLTPLPMATDVSYRLAQQLNNGLIVVSGYFNKYGNVHRSGFMVLNPDGSLAAGYNNTADFSGSLTKVFETTNSSGQTQTLITGLFSTFNRVQITNVVRLLFK
ncbi:DUF5008 domain-containing protein [[Flexibacter] sp. ATCC 35208]|uniref:DUF5008 domain-containing protein n=1 Tax=[Flexibacter] sp. ATCC 35208 TaxID=1936242 RepID=UPI0009CE7BD7|nr:DUF5008 domain-containing protein [[Flexibacter] sp. ATCC 35208]OMP80345.1 hypothetical protein BW716_04265 [[Flexibacter] sp. ATCC 35208]